MPPPQCPECGRFLATAFVEKIKAEPAPCPGCGTELSLAEDEAAEADVATPEESPPVPPPAATLPEEGAAGAGDALDDDDATGPAATEAPDGEEDADTGGAPAVPPPAATLPDDVEPEPETSVRPPDLEAERDPLAGWDESPTITAPDQDVDPAVLAAGAGVGLLLGLLLGGRDHRGLGALLGAVLGAVVARLRG